MTGWRDRLISAVDKDGRSDRAISLAAGLGPNFVNELRRGSKEPGVDKVIRLAKELSVPLPYLFNGIDLATDQVETLEAYVSLSPENRALLLHLARQMRAK